MERLAQCARSSAGVTLIGCGFAFLAILATKPVWSRLLFGYEPSFEDLLLLRCFGP